MTVNELTYFTCEGHWYDVEAADTSGSTNAPQFLVVSAFVTFKPRLAPGTQLYIANLDLGFTLTAPSSLAVTTSSAGGTLASGAMSWVITATNANGETTKSNEVTKTLTGSTSSAVLSWPAQPDASTIKVYRGPTGAENILVTTISNGALTYTDTGSAGTSATPPTTNTAEVSANTSISVAEITGRILEGELQTINRTDTENLQLLANTTPLGLESLIYDVSFTNVVYASAGQTLQNFAFTAPTSATTIDLTDPTLTRLIYNPGGYT